jgi:hypothetical protein
MTLFLNDIIQWASPKIQKKNHVQWPIQGHVSLRSVMRKAPVRELA